MVDVEMTPAAGAAPEAEEPTQQQLQLAQFNEYIHLCRDLYKSDPSMVGIHSLYFKPNPFLVLYQTRSKIKYRNATGLIVLKVTNERKTHKFMITKENEDMGPRFLTDFNSLAFTAGSNVQEKSRPQTASNNKGAKGKQNKNQKKR